MRRLCTGMMVILISIPALAAENQKIDASLFYLPDRYKRFMPLMVKAGKLVAKNPKCLEVLDGSISSDPWPADNPKFFITCKIQHAYPYENFFVTKKEIDAGITPDLPKPVAKERAILLCRNSVKSNATFPSTVSFSWFGIETSVGSNGNTEVLMNLTAKNALGAELPYRARCLVLPDESVETAITGR